MFDIGFSELLLILVIGLLVLGPTRLPIAIRTVMGWIKVIRGMAESVQNEITHELKIQELKEDIKKVEAVNIEQFSPELSKTVNELKESTVKIKQDLNQNIQASKENWDESIKDVNNLNFQDDKVEQSVEPKNTVSTEDNLYSQNEQAAENKDQELKDEDSQKEELPEITLNPDYYSTDDELADIDVEEDTQDVSNHLKKQAIKEKE